MLIHFKNTRIHDYIITNMLVSNKNKKCILKAKYYPAHNVDKQQLKIILGLTSKIILLQPAECRAPRDRFFPNSRFRFQVLREKAEL
jgi:hypothetical protein